MNRDLNIVFDVFELFKVLYSNFVTTLSDTAKSYPQATFVALSKSLQFEWSYLQRLIPNIGNAFTPGWTLLHSLLLSLKPVEKSATAENLANLVGSALDSWGVRNIHHLLVVRYFSLIISHCFSFFVSVTMPPMLSPQCENYLRIHFSVLVTRCSSASNMP